MKILITTGLYPPDIGGPATYTRMLEEKLPDVGIGVEVLSFSTVRQLPFFIRHPLFVLKTFLKLRHADLIFAQDPISVGIASLIAAKLLRKKFFIRIPGDYVWEQARQRWGVRDAIDDFQNKKYGTRIELFRTLQQFVVRRADAVITPSDYFHRLVAGWGVDPEKISTVYNGIDLNVEPSLPEEKPAGRIMVSAGRLVPWKGFDMLIDLLQDVPHWHLVIVGEGNGETALREQAESIGVKDRVTFTGALPREEVFGWLSVADVFVLNTSFESFSFQMVEAMHSGAPVITTHIGSLPELITHGKEGILLSPNDREGFLSAITSTEENPEVWKARSAAAKEKAQQFSIENTINGVTLLVTHHLSKQ